MRSSFVRALACAGGLVVLAAAALWLGGPAAAAGDFYALDTRGDLVLGLLLPDRTLAVRGPAGEQALGVGALSARFLGSGEIVYVDADLALWRFDPSTGLAAELLPTGSANAPLFVSPEGGALAYLKPRDLTTREEVLLPLSNGVAVLDLASGVERVLLEVPDVTVNLYGWAGDQLIVQIPTWDSVTLAPAKALQLAALPNTDPPQLPVPLAELPPLSAATRYPQTSFDQRFLTYETTGGVVVAALDAASPTYAIYGDVHDPRWTESGLTVARAEAREALAWSAAEVNQPAPALNALAWPPAEAPMTAPSSAAAPNALLFFRPVWASTRVSAYMDLNTTYGAIRDWTGWVGSGWVYGHAYDGHWGTDYDGVTGNPVMAPATGWVNRVVIYCCNTYPNGPATFGTSVRLYHGPLSDGLHYWTLVGHLLPDGVQVHEGEAVNGLPRTLALMGNTGWSTGDHTHLQVYRSQNSDFSGSYTIDPYEWGLISDTPPVSPLPTATPTTPPPTTGDLRGTVRDAQNQPVAGASVKLQLAGKIYLTTSGLDGTYAFLSLPPGAASVRAVKGLRWGSAGGTVQVGLVLGGDIALNQCAGQATAADGCPALVHDQAAFVSDVSYDDGTMVSPGQVVQKTWRLRNTGTTTWGAGYQLVFVSGNKEVNTPAAVNVPSTPIDAAVDLSVSMTAAGSTGIHRGYWRLRNPHGVYFGPTLWVELNSQPGAQGTGAPGVGQSWDSTPHKAGQPAAPSSADAASCVVSAPAESGSDTFTVSWEAVGPAPIVSYDVQFLDSSRGVWRDWIRAYPASQTSAPFTGQGGHAYGFRCRAADQAPSLGAWSAANVTTFVRGVTGAPDLRIASLQVRPAPGGGLLATALVENAGSAATQRGFFVDLYRNDPPSGAGDFAGIVNTWVSEPIAAGSTLSLNFALIEPSGNADLYAQVDTGNLVPEANEDNNLWSTAASGCVMQEDAYEYDDVPGAAQPLPVGASQARNFGGPSEQDWAALTLVSGRLYRLETSALGAGMDTQLSIYNAAGSQRLAFNDDRTNTEPSSSLVFAPRGPATSYRLLVDSWNPATGGCGATYTLWLTDLGPAFIQFMPVMPRQ